MCRTRALPIYLHALLRFEKEKCHLETLSQLRKEAEGKGNSSTLWEAREATGRKLYLSSVLPTAVQNHTDRRRGEAASFGQWRL